MTFARLTIGRWRSRLPVWLPVWLLPILRVTIITAIVVAIVAIIALPVIPLVIPVIIAIETVAHIPVTARLAAPTHTKFATTVKVTIASAGLIRTPAVIGLAPVIPVIVHIIV